MIAREYPERGFVASGVSEALSPFGFENGRGFTAEGTRGHERKQKKFLDLLMCSHVPSAVNPLVL
jgi:hypothetical protein